MMLKNLAPFVIVIAGCMWGSVGLFVRALEGYGLNAMSIVETRMLGAFIITFIGVLFYKRELLKIKLKDSWLFVGTGIVSMLLFNYLYNQTISLVTLSLAATLLCTAPIFVLLLSAILFREKMTPIKLIAVTLAIIGCMLVSGLFENAITFSLAGLILGIAASFGYALYSIFSRFAMNKGYESLTINVYSFLFASLGGALFTDFGPINLALQESPFYFGSFLLLHAVIASVAPYILFTWGMKYVDTGRAAILSSCEPVAATLFGIFLYQEVPTLLAIVGILLVLGAITLLNLPKKQPVLVHSEKNSV
ncbi:DMT family transporter [Bacillus tuaregi]|uniref:DMT family transporter n=1 Tax=Bacillus tuaregi TaxID=1816695 RepID=UPI0009FF29D4|nr:EamA family transporter [Bacillus tuaregi]